MIRVSDKAAQASRTLPHVVFQFADRSGKKKNQELADDTSHDHWTKICKLGIVRLVSNIRPGMDQDVGST